MSTTETIIAEYDVVTLRSPAEGWPAGTVGRVVSVFPSHMWVEVSDEKCESSDLVWVPPTELELVRRHRLTPHEAAD